MAGTVIAESTTAAAAGVLASLAVNAGATPDNILAATLGGFIAAYLAKKADNEAVGLAAVSSALFTMFISIVCGCYLGPAIKTVTFKLLPVTQDIAPQVFVFVTAACVHMVVPPAWDFARQWFSKKLSGDKQNV